jgi:hypothetical protein
LNNLADVYLAAGSLFGLNYSGIDVIDSLFIDGTAGAVGTYGAIGSGADFQMALFSGPGRLRVTRLGLLGDYNGDGTVDAADYTVWRNRLGSVTALSNDDSLGVDQDDYDRWKSNFGQTAGAGSRAMESATVPEPLTRLLVLLAACGVCLRRAGFGTTGQRRVRS